MVPASHDPPQLQLDRAKKSGRANWRTLVRAIWWVAYEKNDALIAVWYLFPAIFHPSPSIHLFPFSISLSSHSSFFVYCINQHGAEKAYEELQKKEPDLLLPVSNPFLDFIFWKNISPLLPSYLFPCPQLNKENFSGLSTWNFDVFN